MRNTLPNFIIIGAQKVATTSLYPYLRHHPEKLNEHLKKELTDKYYKADILQLEKLIEKDLALAIN